MSEKKEEQLGYSKEELKQLQEANKEANKEQQKESEKIICNCNCGVEPFGVLDLVKCKICKTLYQPIKDSDGIIRFDKVIFPEQEIFIETVINEFHKSFFKEKTRR